MLNILVCPPGTGGKAHSPTLMFMYHTYTHVHIPHTNTHTCAFIPMCAQHTHIYIAKQAPGAFNLIDEQFTFPFFHIVSGDFTSMFSSTFSDFVIMAVMTRMELPSFL